MIAAETPLSPGTAAQNYPTLIIFFPTREQQVSLAIVTCNQSGKGPPLLTIAPLWWFLWIKIVAPGIMFSFEGKNRIHVILKRIQTTWSLFIFKKSLKSNDNLSKSLLCNQMFSVVAKNVTIPLLLMINLPFIRGISIAIHRWNDLHFVPQMHRAASTKT